MATKYLDFGTEGDAWVDAATGWCGDHHLFVTFQVARLRKVRKSALHGDHDMTYFIERRVSAARRGGTWQTSEQIVLPPWAHAASTKGGILLRDTSLLVRQPDGGVVRLLVTPAGDVIAVQDAPLMQIQAGGFDSTAAMYLANDVAVQVCQGDIVFAITPSVPFQVDTSVDDARAILDWLSTEQRPHVRP